MVKYCNAIELKKLIANLPKEQVSRLPQKIVDLVNRPEHTEYLKAILLGALLVLEDKEITIDWKGEQTPVLKFI
jgi:hypothetical protein